MKFYFRAQDIQILLPGVDTQSKLVVVWKRVPRRTTTGAIDVVEFEFNSALGSWNARSSQRRPLRSTLAQLESYGYGCFWHDAPSCGCFWRADRLLVAGLHESKRHDLTY